MPHPATKRRRIAPRRRFGWAEQMLADRFPPADYPDWLEYERWREGKLVVAGLPDPQSDEGRQLLRTMKVSVR